MEKTVECTEEKDDFWEYAIRHHARDDALFRNAGHVVEHHREPELDAGIL
jgi:hypothetical protein